MIGEEHVDRIVVVHGPADPILTHILTDLGRSVANETGDITVWASRRHPLGSGRPDSVRVRPRDSADSRERTSLDALP
ncbi:MAG TPA: hypothetical protein VLX59_02400 [Acidimicrobiales bacterium]|nr:hypothetical protein [Acidimicrobiales bacterium]